MHANKMQMILIWYLTALENIAYSINISNPYWIHLTNLQLIVVLDGFMMKCVITKVAGCWAKPLWVCLFRSEIIDLLNTIIISGRRTKRRHNIFYYIFSINFSFSRNCQISTNSCTLKLNLLEAQSTLTTGRDNFLPN